MLTSDGLRFQLRVVGTFQKKYILLKSPSFGVFLLLLLLCYRSLCYLGGKAQMVEKFICCQHDSPKFIFFTIPYVFNLKPDISG